MRRLFSVYAPNESHISWDPRPPGRLIPAEAAPPKVSCSLSSARSRGQPFFWHLCSRSWDTQFITIQPSPGEFVTSLIHYSFDFNAEESHSLFPWLAFCHFISFVHLSWFRGAGCHSPATTLAFMLFLTSILDPIVSQRINQLCFFGVLFPWLLSETFGSNDQNSGGTLNITVSNEKTGLHSVWQTRLVPSVWKRMKEGCLWGSGDTWHLNVNTCIHLWILDTTDASFGWSTGF